MSNTKSIENKRRMLKRSKKKYRKSKCRMITSNDTNAEKRNVENVKNDSLVYSVVNNLIDILKRKKF